jgi:hypothetical protein
MEEQDERLLPEFLRLYKYTDEEIGVAMNTFRGPDRYIELPTKRLRAIASRPIEQNIVSYAHARHCGAMLLDLLEVRDRNIQAKPGRDHYDYFKDYWYPYFRSVEDYFELVSQDFEPESLNVDRVYETVRKYSN